MSTEQNMATIRRWIEEGLNQGKLDLVDQVHAANVVQHDPNSPMPVTSSAALKVYVGGYRSAFPYLHFTVDDVLRDLLRKAGCG